MTDTRPARRPSAARRRLLDAADRVFYAEGIHSVGVDRVIEEAKVTRATFYRHFPSKEELVLAYLEARDQAVRAQAAQAAAQASRPQELLDLVVRGIGDELCGPGFRGCPFINAAAEYPDPDHPVHRAVVAHRTWFEETVAGLLAAAGHPEPKAAAHMFLMLRDGAMVAGYLGDSETARRRLVRAAEAIFQADR